MSLIGWFYFNPYQSIIKSVKLPLHNRPKTNSTACGGAIPNNAGPLVITRYRSGYPNTIKVPLCISTLRPKHQFFQDGLRNHGLRHLFVYSQHLFDFQHHRDHCLAQTLCITRCDPIPPPPHHKFPKVIRIGKNGERGEQRSTQELWNICKGVAYL